MAKKSKYIFDKPDLSIVNSEAKNHRSLYHQAMHYAQYEMTDKQLRKSVIAYAKENKLDHKLLNVLKDWELTTIGKYAYIVVGGGQLPEDVEIGFQRRMNELLEKAEIIKAERKAEAKENAKIVTGPVLTVQDRMRMQAETVGAQFDDWLDNLMLGQVKTVTKEMDPMSQMKLASFKAGQARYIKSFYESELNEIKEVISGKDTQVKEGYSNIKKSSALRVKKLLESIITSAEMLATVSNAARKTRKKKMPTVEKQVSKVKYCVEHKEYGIASISPAGIVGASEVWVFNTKYRKLGRYVASDAGGLSIKGTTIKGYSDSESRQKTLRKPKAQLKDFMSSGKVKIRKFLGNIKAVDTKMNGRLSDKIVILKVFK